MNEQSSSSVNSRVAIFLDWQNSRATASQIRCLIMFAYSIGFPIIRNAYADWGQEDKKLSDLLSDLFDCINIPSSKCKKNRVDLRLIEDCIKRVSKNSEINTVILVSGDGDFQQLVQSLKDRGKRVIVIAQCQKNTNQKLRELADEFYLLSQIEKKFRNIKLAA